MQSAADLARIALHLNIFTAIQVGVKLMVRGGSTGLG